MIVACRQPLARLLATCPGVDQVVAEGSSLPDFDVYAPLMSLPQDLRDHAWRTCRPRSRT